MRVVSSGGELLSNASHVGRNSCKAAHRIERIMLSIEIDNVHMDRIAAGLQR